MPRLSKVPKLYRLASFFLIIIIIVFLVWLIWPKPARDTVAQNPPDSLSSVSVPSSDDVSKPQEIIESSTKPNPAIVSNSDLDYLLGKTDFTRHPEFVYVSDAKYVTQRIPIHKEVFSAFKEMQAAAAEDQINFRIVSAARSWSRQKSIWENKLSILGYQADLPRADKIRIIRQALRYNSHPGISRHHWGTDLDLNSVEPSYFETDKGKRELAWLDENAGKYGFVKAYTNDPARGGFSYEPWHWSWAPMSVALYRQYLEKVSYASFTGFTGSELLSEFSTIETYVKGINPTLR